MDNNTQSKKLYRSRADKVIAGVCGGLGEYFNVDSLIFRLIFLVLLFAGGGGLWLYIILAILIPRAPLPGQPDNYVSPKERVQEFAAEIRESAHRWVAEAHSADHERRREHRRMWIGLVIVAIGIAALVNVLFPNNFFPWQALWPIAIIVLGVAVISKGSRR